MTPEEKNKILDQYLRSLSKRDPDIMDDDDEEEDWSDENFEI